MSKIRVYELAKKLGKASGLLVDELRAMGVEGANNFTALDEGVVVQLEGKIAGAKVSATVKSPAGKKAPAAQAGKSPSTVSAPSPAVAESSPQPVAASKPAAKSPRSAPAKHSSPAPLTPASAIIRSAAPAIIRRSPAPKQPEAEVEVHPPAEVALKAPGAAAPVHEKAEAAPEASERLAQSPKVPKGPVEHAAEVKRSDEPSPPSSTEEDPAAIPHPPVRFVSAPPVRLAAPARVPGSPMVHHGPGVTPKFPSAIHPAPYSVAPSTGHPAPARPAQPAGLQRPRPTHAPGAGRPVAQPARPGQPQRPPHQRDQRPADQRPAAPGARAPEAGKPPGRPAVPQRKSKRDRRLDKLQAKENRRERLETELEQARANAETGEAVFIREGVSVKELADKLNQKVRDVIAKLMSRGILATINQPLDTQVAIELCSQFGFAAEVISFEDEMVLEQDEAPEESKSPRAPVVTIMGHVDHGKSSLLEAIHDVDITSKEHGGITQHIGAYKVSNKGRDYVFLDTPGHEAFTLMRARGAQVTDIVILVVAADDSVMPQTIEAINHCRAANVPMVVAINKMDKPGADIDRVKRNLSEQGILTEDWGGDVVSVAVSAKSHQGIEELLDMVSLVADMLNLKANLESMATGTVLESRMDRARGAVATVLIQDGNLKVSDLFLCGTTYGHVRNLFDDKGVRVESAGPSTPVEVLGFSEVPAVGALFQGMSDEAKTRQVASFRKEQEKARAQRTTKVRLENVFGAIQQGEIQELPIILKADVYGSLEAVAQKLNELSTDEIKVRIVHQGVGAVSESDILLASASNALILGFNVRPERKALDLAKSEGVEVHLFTVIYHLIDRMKQALTGMLKPIEEEAILGHAEVRQVFKVSKVGTVAGCVVIDGKVVKAASVRILRDNVVVHTGKMNALKRFKDDASEVKDGTECGISIENYNDIKPGDVIESYEITFQERTL